MSEVDRLVELITQRVQERLATKPAARLNVLPRDRGDCDDDSAPGEDCASCGSCVVRRPWSVRAMEEVGAMRVGAMAGIGEVPADLAKMIDHTLLKNDATRDEVVKLCEEARKYKFASVCVNTTWVPLCKAMLANSGVMVCAVVGFPLGAMLPTAKAYEARDAVRQGAQEIDMVLNIGALTHEEKIIASSLSKLAGAAFVKTSTGFGKGGATVEDVQLMRSIVGGELGVKASGGVRTAEDAIKMAQAGANRVGASASVAIVTGKSDTKAKGY